MKGDEGPGGGYLIFPGLGFLLSKIAENSSGSLQNEYYS